MTIKAWTFLISRNQSIDYKTVVAPDFISEAKIRSLLAKATEEDFTESGRITIREIKGSEVGNLTIVFRSVKARNNDIGEPGNEVLKDPFGREIYCVEGLVFRKNWYEIQHKIGESHLDQAHKDLQEKYCEFWHEDNLSSSNEIDLVEVISEPENKFIVLDPFVIPPKPQWEGEPRRNSHSQRKTVRNKTNLFRLVLIVIAVLLLTGIFWKVWSDSQLPSICLYVTQDVAIFNQSNQPFSSPKLVPVIDELKKLKEKHTTASIWLTGSLNVEKPFFDQIQNEIIKQKKDNEKMITSPMVNSPLTLYIKNHPIDFAIDLLQNKKVTSGELNATIIEPISPKQSSCKL